jgi:hypothetical protein
MSAADHSPLSNAPLPGLSAILPLITAQLESSRIGAADGEIDRRATVGFLSNESKVCPRSLDSCGDDNGRRKSQARGIPSEDGSPDLGFELAINPYRGPSKTTNAQSRKQCGE